MGIHENTEDMTGNIVLFKKSTHLVDQVISYTTHGPYIHTGIIVDSINTYIAATLYGITYNALSSDRTKYTVISLLAPPFKMEQITWENQLQKGVLWAKKQAGIAYNWIDILDQGLDFLFPGNSIHLVDQSHYDCSDFVCRYLMEIGYPLSDILQNPYAVSPNDLARFFKILT